MSIFTGLEQLVETIGSALAVGFSSVSTIFYDPSLGTGGEITLVGYLLIAALAVGFIKLALNLIVRLFTRVK